jgi:hypothetical protein
VGGRKGTNPGTEIVQRKEESIVYVNVEFVLIRIRFCYSQEIETNMIEFYFSPCEEFWKVSLGLVCFAMISCC